MELGKPQGRVEPGAAVLGWRAWAVTRTSQGVRLASPLFDHLWLPGEPAVASCLRHEDRFAAPLGVHDVGSADCGCGFHAARDPADALSYLHGRDAPSTRDPTGRVFDALADPNRRYVLEALASRETATATELAAELPVSST